MRAKPIKLDDIITIKDNELFEDNSDFFHLPSLPLRKRHINQRNKHENRVPSNYGSRNQSMERTVQRAIDHHPGF